MFPTLQIVKSTLSISVYSNSGSLKQEPELEANAEMEFGT